MHGSELIHNLLAKGIVQIEQVDGLTPRADKIIEHLVSHNAVDQIGLVREVASYYGLEYIELSGFKVSSELFAVLPVNIALRHGCLPLEITDAALTVAVGENYQPGVEGILERVTGREIRLKMAPSSLIEAVFNGSEAASQLLSSISDQFVSTQHSSSIGREDSLELDRLETDDASVTQLINGLILDALQRRASDIHIERDEKTVGTKYRIDGVIQSATRPIDARHHATIISRLKVMAELDIAEKRVPQDGKFRLSVGGRNIDFRVSILPGVYGEDVVIRVLDKAVISDDVKLKLSDLGFDEEILRNLKKSISEPYGMVLITGPTGSGKTTTLYAAINEIHDGTQKIITIEDPVEYHLEGVVQIPVNEKKQLTFSKGLRSILRHDPDKIMVGEIRDLETAEIAIQSSLTGHLVFSTVHANNVFDVIGRFTHMGVDIYNFVAALNCVMAQRLVRKICPHCCKPHLVTEVELDEYGLVGTEYAATTWYQGTGCNHCNHTGYRGRTTITEYMKVTAELREMIIARQPVSALLKLARLQGLFTLRESGLRKAALGLTTLAEVNRVTFVD